MSVMMELTIDHGIIKRIAFETMEQAQIELDKLKPLLGKDPYDKWRNKEIGDTTHTINAPAGEQVIVLHKISSVGLVDGIKAYEVTKDLDDLAIKRKAVYDAANQIRDPIVHPTDNK